MKSVHYIHVYISTKTLEEKVEQSHNFLEWTCFLFIQQVLEKNSTWITYIYEIHAQVNYVKFWEVSNLQMVEMYL